MLRGLGKGKGRDGVRAKKVRGERGYEVGAHVTNSYNFKETSVALAASVASELGI
jgi:hypothetical protein